MNCKITHCLKFPLTSELILGATNRQAHMGMRCRPVDVWSRWVTCFDPYLDLSMQLLIVMKKIKSTAVHVKALVDLAVGKKNPHFQPHIRRVEVCRSCRRTVCWPELLHCVFFFFLLALKRTWSAHLERSDSGMSCGSNGGLCGITTRASLCSFGGTWRALHADIAGDTLSPAVQLSSTNITFYCSVPQRVKHYAAASVIMRGARMLRKKWCWDFARIQLAKTHNFFPPASAVKGSQTNIHARKTFFNPSSRMIISKLTFVEKHRWNHENAQRNK